MTYVKKKQTQLLFRLSQLFLIVNFIQKTTLQSLNFIKFQFK